jgi:hypothetical protein
MKILTIGEIVIESIGLNLENAKDMSKLPNQLAFNDIRRVLLPRLPIKIFALIKDKNVLNSYVVIGYKRENLNL